MKETTQKQGYQYEALWAHTAPHGQPLQKQAEDNSSWLLRCIVSAVLKTHRFSINMLNVQMFCSFLVAPSQFAVSCLS